MIDRIRGWWRRWRARRRTPQLRAILADRPLPPFKGPHDSVTD